MVSRKRIAEYNAMVDLYGRIAIRPKYNVMADLYRRIAIRPK